MKLVVLKNYLMDQILYRSLDPPKNGVIDESEKVKNEMKNYVKTFLDSVLSARQRNIDRNRKSKVPNPVVTVPMSPRTPPAQPATPPPKMSTAEQAKQFWFSTFLEKKMIFFFNFPFFYYRPFRSRSV